MFNDKVLFKSHVANIHYNHQGHCNEYPQHILFSEVRNIILQLFTHPTLFLCNLSDQGLRTSKCEGDFRIPVTAFAVNENCHCHSREKTQYIVWVCNRNARGAT